MSKWFYFFPVIAVSVAAAVFFSRPAPVSYHSGVVNIDTLFTSNSEFLALKMLQKKSNRFGRSIFENSSKVAAPVADSDIMKSEWDIFFKAASLRNETLSQARQEKVLSLLEREVDATSDEFSRRRKKLFAASSAKLDKKYNDISDKLPLPSLLFNEKFNLFNLKLKLEVLTNDSFVMPDTRLKTINRKIDELEKVINDAEQQYMAEIRNRFQHESDEIRSNLEDAQEELEIEFELSLDNLLNANRKKLSNLIQSDQEETSEMLVAASTARRSMISSFENYLDQFISAPDPDATDLDELEIKLKTEFVRRASRRAPAIAEKNSVSIIFNTKFNEAGNSTDLTDKF